MPPKPWEHERENELTALWATGLSTAKIGEKMGITKNAVVGKANRLKLRTRGSPLIRMQNGRGKRPIKKSLAKRNPKKEIASRPKNMPLVPLADLGNGCPWPYGDPQDDDFGFCGQEKDGKTCYCAEHNKRAYLPKKKRSGRVTFNLKPLTQFD